MDGPPDLPQLGTELEEFFDLSIDLLCIVGFDGYFKRVNASLQRTLGYPMAELRSRSVFDITHPDDVQRSAEALSQLGEGHDVVGFESRVVCADGSVRWLEWNTRTMPERGVVYGVARDTTERRRAEAELLEAQRHARGRAATRCACSPTSRPRCGAWPRWSLGRPRPTPCSPRWGARSARCSASTPRTWAAMTRTARSSASRSGAATRASRSGHGSRSRATACPRGCCAPGERHAWRRYEDAPGVIAATIRQLGIRFSVGVPITVGGRPWGVMIASSKGPDPFPAETESRLQDFTELLATAISNAEARADLAASRARLVAAADDERRRVVRDLHDGAQQRLVHTVLTLKLAQRELAGQTGQAPELVNDALAYVQDATAELRELAHGIMPGVLAHGGLPAATRALATRMAIPVEIDMAVPRLPGHIEATAYFVVAESLTNVAKHAHAQHATVTGSRGRRRAARRGARRRPGRSADRRQRPDRIA